MDKFDSLLPAAHEPGIDVEIVIPTLASADRRDQLLRAISSVFDAAEQVQARVLVCVNGSRHDAATLAHMSNMPFVTVHRLEIASLPKAIADGRRRVTAPLFGFLDDDDMLLPGALDRRIKVLQNAPENVDVVISNGLRRVGGVDQRMLDRLADAARDPLRALMSENWLPSCGALYRTDRIGQAYFDDYHDFAEWSWLAYQLAVDGKRLVACDEPTFIVNDTPASRSKSHLYRDSYLHLFQRMLDRRPPKDVRQAIQRRMSAALHDTSEERLREGRIWAATGLHLRSLKGAGGWRYLGYTRHILAACLNR